MLQVKLIKYGVAALAAAALLGGVWYGGFQTAYNEQQIIIEQTEKNKTAALLAAEKAYSAELERVRRLNGEQAEKTQQAGIKLAAANAEISRLKQQHKKGITHAIEQDKHAAGNACIDGLGAHGLRQYRQALGYGAN